MALFETSRRIGFKRGRLFLCETSCFLHPMPGGPIICEIFHTFIQSHLEGGIMSPIRPEILAFAKAAEAVIKRATSVLRLDSESDEERP